MRALATKKSAWELMLAKKRRKRESERAKLAKKKVQQRAQTNEAQNKTHMRDMRREMLERADRAVYEASPLQRHKRDIHVITQHMMNADSVTELAGRVMLGADEHGRGL